MKANASKMMSRRNATGADDLRKARAFRPDMKGSYTVRVRLCYVDVDVCHACWWASKFELETTETMNE